MKVICHRENLLSACKLAVHVVARRDVKPLLRNFHLQATDKLAVGACDLEPGIRINVQGVKVDEPGEAMLPSRLIEILEHGVGEEVEIAAGKIAIGKDCYEFTAEDPSGFPNVPEFTKKTYHEIPAGVLLGMIQRTVFAAATEGQVRVGATLGVLWKLEDGKVALIATDGKRMAINRGIGKSHGGHTTLIAEEQKDAPRACVVPAKAMRLLKECLSGADEGQSVKVFFRKGEVFFSTANTEIYSRLVEGRFPDYKSVIPKKSDHLVTASPALLASAFTRAGIVCVEESKGVECEIYTGKLTLRGKGVESGKSCITIPVSYKGKGITILVDPLYVVQAMSAIDASVPVEWGITTSGRPMTFRQGSFLYVVVPLVQTK